MRATKLIINDKNLKNNITAIKSLLKPGVKICTPVKANAYGHGAIHIAKKALEYGVDMVSVAAVSEGKELRENGITCTILLFSLPLPEECKEIVKLNLTPFIFDPEIIDILDLESEKAHTITNIFLAIDTGMGRIGCTPEKAAEIAQYIEKKKNIKLSGCSTHCAVSDSLKDDDISYTRDQFKKFEFAIAEIKKAGINPGICTAASTGSTLQYPEAQFDMVRPGLIVYGYFPDDEFANYMNKKHPDFKLTPIMSLVTQITSIKTVSKGTSISYGCTWHSDKETKIATLPIGYADGLVRKLSPGLKVQINGKYFPIVGRICMDQCMVDISSDNDIKRFDKVVIFSSNGQTLQTLADKLGTITYELMCGIAPRVPRIYTAD